MRSQIKIKKTHFFLRPCAPCPELSSNLRTMESVEEIKLDVTVDRVTAAEGDHGLRYVGQTERYPVHILRKGVQGYTLCKMRWWW